MFEETGSLNTEQIILNILVAVILGGVIYLSYYFTHAGGVYSKKFNNYSRNCRIAEYECKKKFNNLIILRVGNIFGELRTKPSYIEKIIISLVNKLDFVENKLKKYNQNDDVFPGQFWNAKTHAFCSLSMGIFSDVEKLTFMSVDIIYQAEPM